MKLLIIGGTRFVGKHLVDAALKRGHQITLFNRGKYPSAPLPEVETIVGDRNKDLAKLHDRTWDVVIDTCGYLPRSVSATAETLSASVDRYVFISSLSVYKDFTKFGIDESAPLATLTDEQLQRANEIDSSGQTSAVTYGELYPGLKSLCEQSLEAAMPGRALVVRPGLIAGPHDYTDRLTYWVTRVARGGEVLAPGRSERFVQLIDVRDLAEWILSMIERGQTGTFNATGLPNNLTMKQLLEECKSVAGSDASFTWTDEEFLLAEKVVPWNELPFWLPDAAAHMRGFMFVNIDKAVAAGLNFRPLKDTIRDVLEWRQTNFLKEQLKAGIEPDKEKALLEAWAKRVS